MVWPLLAQPQDPIPTSTTIPPLSFRKSDNDGTVDLHTRRSVAHDIPSACGYNKLYHDTTFRLHHPSHTLILSTSFTRQDELRLPLNHIDQAAGILR